MKTCTKCNVEKSLSEFYPSKRKESWWCKLCSLEYQRDYYWKNIETIRKRMKPRTDHQKSLSKKNSEKYYSSILGRAKTLLKGVKDRQSDHTLTLDWFVEQLSKGVCSVTGIAFDFSKHPKYKKNPYAPSVDRVDSSKGYSIDNCRLVIWQYNMGKGETTDEEFYDFCRKVVDSKVLGVGH